MLALILLIAGVETGLSVSHSKSSKVLPHFPTTVVTATLEDLQQEKQKWEGEKQIWEKEKLLWDRERLKWQSERQQWQAMMQQWQNYLHQVQSENEFIRGKVMESHNHKESQSPCLEPVSVQDLSSLPDKDRVYTRSDDMGSIQTVIDGFAQRLSEVSAEVQALKVSRDQLLATVSQSQTSSYIIWGRSTCPVSTETVYSGIIGGSPNSEAGAAANYLCLPLSPELSDSKLPTYSAFLFGAEYQTYNTNPLHANKDPLCALCRIPRAVNVMLPASNTCWPGWTLEYSGFLMAGDSRHSAASEFICIDSTLEDRAGSERNENAKLLLYTVSHCGSLPCPPYANSKVVTCAVCSI